MFVRQAPTAVGKIFAVVTVLELIFFFLLFSWFYGERIETLRERIQSRDDQIARLKTQPTDSAKQEIDQLRRELTELRKGHPYTVPPEDEVEFIQTLRSTGHIRVAINHADDDKAAALTKRLSVLFESSDWDVNTSDGPQISGNLAPEILVWASPESKASLPAAGLLQALLKKQHIEVRIHKSSFGEGGIYSLQIFVGPAPEYLPKQ